MCQTVLKHVLLMKAKRSTLEMKHFVRERRDPLLTMTIQVMNEEFVSSERTVRAVIETSEKMLNDQKDMQQSRSLQSNQPIPNPIQYRTGQPVVRIDRTGQPVVGTHMRTVQDGRKTSRSQEIDTRSLHEEAVKTGRTGQPVVETHTQMCLKVRKHILVMKA